MDNLIKELLKIDDADEDSDISETDTDSELFHPSHQPKFLEKQGRCICHSRVGFHVRVFRSHFCLVYSFFLLTIMALVSIIFLIIAGEGQENALVLRGMRGIRVRKELVRLPQFA